MSPENPIPFERENITPRHKDIKLSKLRRIRDRALQPGEEYVRKNEYRRVVVMEPFNGRLIPFVEWMKSDVVKNYDPEPPNNWALVYTIKLGTLRITQLSKLIKRLVNRTARLRKVLALPDVAKHFTPTQIQMLNFQFMRMAKQLEMAVGEAKGRIHANA